MNGQKNSYTQRAESNNKYNICYITMNFTTIKMFVIYMSGEVDYTRWDAGAEFDEGPRQGQGSCPTATPDANAREPPQNKTPGPRRGPCGTPKNLYPVFWPWIMKLMVVAMENAMEVTDLFLIGLLVFVFDVLPQLALVVGLPNVVGSGVEPALKQQRTHSNGEDEGGRPSCDAVVHQASQTHFPASL
eukprot:TRINITY_DN14325_c1_g2_i1.p1 TRINITY_DN14325_c1_g2~~TRINITY_DN14325_c1_g2_i1.p1  ORF type:complete len:188 (+),score=0.83 TRINITY_DN14325_c1_g2_i1:183-746(+)